MSLGQQTGFDVGGPAPVGFNMGLGVPVSYDGLRLSPGDGSKWKQAPANVPLYPAADKFFVTQGHSVPLQSEMVFQQLPADSMAYFSRNRASPLCSGDYATSTGVICTTQEQRDYIGQRRGGNNDYPTNPPI